MVKLYFPESAPSVQYVYKDTGEVNSQIRDERDECLVKLKTAETALDAKNARVKELEAVIERTRTAATMNELLVSKLSEVYKGSEIWKKIEEVQKRAEVIDQTSLEYADLSGLADKLSQELMDQRKRLHDHEKDLEKCRVRLHKSRQSRQSSIAGADEQIARMCARQKALDAVFVFLMENDIQDYQAELKHILEREASLNDIDRQFLGKLQYLHTGPGDELPALYKQMASTREDCVGHQGDVNAEYSSPRVKLEDPMDNSRSKPRSFGVIDGLDERHEVISSDEESPPTTADDGPDSPPAPAGTPFFERPFVRAISAVPGGPMHSDDEESEQSSPASAEIDLAPEDEWTQVKSRGMKKAERMKQKPWV